MDRTTSNKFGEGTLYQIEDLKGSIYFECAACMSLYAEALSWANAHPDRIVKTALEADNIVMISCQVTDLAVLNDLRRLEAIKKEREARDSKHNYYICGCLARRFDIELPDGLLRLDHVREDYQWINDRSLVTFAPPFWVPNFDNEVRGRLEDGYRMRDQYPLRIGVGCTNQCSYCTIRVTRGTPYRLDGKRLVEEFMHFDNVVLVSDSPKPSQIKWWSSIALAENKRISIRNVEPWVALKSWDSLEELSTHSLLDTLHVPVQSVNPDVLRKMGRDPDSTLHFIARAQLLREFSHVITNIIIEDSHRAPDIDCVEKLFDSVAWNPMWDGTWDREKAAERFKRYFPWSKGNE